jgi:hypothetical protein
MRYFKALNSMKPTKSELMNIIKYLHKKASYQLSLETNLLSWVGLVGSKRSKDSIMLEVIKRISESESLASENKVIGKDKLLRQSYAKCHKPKNKGITVFVECCDVETRKALISSYHDFRRLCTEAWQRTKQGLKVDWPIGAIKPVMLINNHSFYV